MTQPYPYISLSDWSDTIVLSSGTNVPGDFTIVRGTWSPKVATLRTNQSGGQGAYQDVLEEMEINITGSSVDNLYTNINRLITMLERARKATNGESIIPSGPVLFTYIPQGSTSNIPLQTYVLGPPPGESGVELPPNWVEVGMTRFAMRCRLRFMRRGRWIRPAPAFGYRNAVTYQASSVEPITTVHQVAFPEPQSIFAPASIAIQIVLSTSSPFVPAGYLCYSSRYPTVVIDAENTNAGSNFSVVSESSTFARNGAILRYTPTSSSLVTSNWINNGGLTPLNALRKTPIAVIAAVRTNNSSRQYWLRIDLRDTNNRPISTDLQPIPQGSTLPQLVRMGIIVSSTYISPFIRFSCQVNDASGSPTLDIDYIAFVPLANRASRIIQHDREDITIFTTGEQCLVARYNELSMIPVEFGFSGSPNEVNQGYLSYYDAADVDVWFPTQSSFLYATWLATSGTYWRFASSSTSLANTKLHVTRDFAYLSPQ